MAKRALIGMNRGDAEERAREQPPDPRKVDPKYLEHHDAREILETIRDQQMHPHKFPT